MTLDNSSCITRLRSQVTTLSLKKYNFYVITCYLVEIFFFL